MTWLSRDVWNTYGLVSHELGHAIGWPHSTGDYGREYDSKWDVMSTSFIKFDPPWGWRGVHTIMPHKRAAGWIPEARVLEMADAGVRQVRLARSAFPPAGGFQMIVVPADADHRYVVEARLRSGYDDAIPGEAVVIHEVRGVLRS